MKRILILLALLAVSCGPSNFNDEIYHEFGPSNHWLVTFVNPNTSKEEMREHAQHLANPTKTTFVYFWGPDTDISLAQNADSQEGMYKMFDIEPVEAFTITPDGGVSDFIYIYGN